VKHLVIGLGQVGTGVQKVLECEAHDPHKGVVAEGQFDVIHICYSFSDSFVSDTLAYKEKFGAKYIVIHSTVPIGTSTLCGAVHSPIRGVHPHLEKSIRVFVKYFGGKDAGIMAREFEAKGVRCMCTEKSETTELGKLLDTSCYGLNILIEKEMYRLAKKYGVPHDISYTHMNDTYNKGYMDMGMPQFHKYNIMHMDGGVGGHCILENIVLMKDSGMDTWIADVMLEHADKETGLEKPYLDKAWFYCEHLGKGRTLKDIGAEFGVSGENIGQIAKRHNWIIDNKKWLEEDIEKVIELNKQGKNFKEIAEIIGKDYHSIRNKVYKFLNLKSPYQPGEETKKEDVKKKISATLQGISLEEWEKFKESENALFRKSLPYQEWRLKVFQRDNYKCVKCGSGGELNADHIKLFALYPELRTDLDNGQTLCISCHKEKTKLDWELLKESRNDGE
jgi:hypothetical protein